MHFSSKYTYFFLFLGFSLVSLGLNAQKATFSLDDTLRGSITPERAWWDLTYYKLKVTVVPDKKSISGSNEIHYKVLNANQVLQIDLQPPLKIERVEQNKESLEFSKRGKNAYFVNLNTPQIPGSQQSLTVWYSGKPKEAVRAPWDGGFSWSKDEKDRPFIATSCQGLGASVWWPCKDHAYDEPDSQSVQITVPSNLMDVSNGRLRSTIKNTDGTNTYEWFVSNPINNYGVNINIANYVHFSDTLNGEKGVLSLDYYVLPENLEKAKVHFLQAKSTIRAFEYWFGPYPFYEDGYKLVEVPYLGMEHQSSVTYGNHYMNGYLGRDLSRTGWGMKWDFIIVHESGHEWFANNVTYRDIADMWIHESFTNYSECLYTEFYHGKAAGSEYVRGCRELVENISPIIGTYGVNNEGSSDMYYKGGNMLHTIRQIIGNDKLWRDILRGINKEFYHQTVDGSQIETYIINQSKKNLSKVFDQYLRDYRIPIFEFKIKKNVISYRWTNCIDGFDMPLDIVGSGEKKFRLEPTTEWKKSKISGISKRKFQPSENYYIQLKQQ